MTDTETIEITNDIVGQTIATAEIHPDADAEEAEGLGRIAGARAVSVAYKQDALKGNDVRDCPEEARKIAARMGDHLGEHTLNAAQKIAASVAQHYEVEAEADEEEIRHATHYLLAQRIRDDHDAGRYEAQVTAHELIRADSPEDAYDAVCDSLTSGEDAYYEYLAALKDDIDGYYAIVRERLR